MFVQFKTTHSTRYIYFQYMLINKPVSAYSGRLLIICSTTSPQTPNPIAIKSEKYRQSALNRTGSPCRSSSSGHLNDIRMFG